MKGFNNNDPGSKKVGTLYEMNTVIFKWTVVTNKDYEVFLKICIQSCVSQSGEPCSILACDD